MRLPHTLGWTRWHLLVVCFAVTISSRPAPAGNIPSSPKGPGPGRSYDMQDIRLELSFDWGEEKVIGIETMTLVSLRDSLTTICLDAGNMTVTSVRSSSGESPRYEQPGKEDRLVVSLDRIHGTGDTIGLRIEYHTNGPGPGVTFTQPGPEDESRPQQIWTHGEPEKSHYWFPCYDHPDDFVRTEVIATVRKPLMVISNGKLLDTVEEGDSMRTFHWKMDQPHAVYLTSFVVGAYGAISARSAGIPLTSYVYDSEREEGRRTTSRLPDMVAFFSRQTGIPYPYPKYSQAIVRDFEGGIENISATTLTDLVIHQTHELDQPAEGLQAHELAHQWFGDYVTCSTWSDVWLNEGFATYFQGLWDEHTRGHGEFLYLDILPHQEASFRAWHTDSRRPMVAERNDDPDDAFDSYAYSRGAAVLHMLRETIGEDSWRAAIHTYLRTNATHPVTTNDFRVAVEAAVGEPMQWFFDQWVYSMGYPVLRVIQQYDPALQQVSLTVRQEARRDTLSSYPQTLLFRMPVRIGIRTAARLTIEKVMIAATPEQRFSFPVDSRPLLVGFDYGGTLLTELRFDKSIDDLIFQATRDEDVTGRLRALRRLREVLQEERDSVALMAIGHAICAVLLQDKFWGVRLEAAKSLKGLKYEEAVSALVTATEDPSANVRIQTIRSLSAMQDARFVPTYISLLKDSSYRVIRAAAIALGETRSPGAYDALLRLLHGPSWRENNRIAALKGLKALGDERCVGDVVAFSARGNPVNVRIAALEALVAIAQDDPRTFAIVSGMLLNVLAPPNPELLKPLAKALVAIGDRRGIETFEKAIHTLPASHPFIRELSHLEQRLLEKSQTKEPR